MLGVGGQERVYGTAAAVVHRAAGWTVRIVCPRDTKTAKIGSVQPAPPWAPAGLGGPFLGVHVGSWVTELTALRGYSRSASRKACNPGSFPTSSSGLTCSILPSVQMVRTTVLQLSNSVAMHLGGRCPVCRHGLLQVEGWLQIGSLSRRRQVTSTPIASGRSRGDRHLRLPLFTSLLQFVLDLSVLNVQFVEPDLQILCALIRDCRIRPARGLLCQ